MAKLISFMEESHLIVQVRNGDAGAFTCLFEKYSGKLYRFAYGFLKSKEDAEEVVQDAFVRLWEAREKLDENGSLGGYLFRITYRLVMNRFRSAALEKRHAENMPRPGETARNTTEQELAGREMEQLVEMAVSALPPRRKMIFQLSRYSQLTHQEIADQMHISKKTVEAQITEALRQVRRYLSIHGDWLSILIIFCFCG
jgi:RNA polymerase sigma-70 factor (ECF subfamily)